MGQERRLNPRAIVRRTARLRVGRDAAWQEVLLHDLSASGACIHAGMPLSADAELALRMDLPGAEGGSEGEEPSVIEVDVVLVRAAPVAPPDPSRPYLYGLHFLGIRPEDFDRVRRYVWGRLHAETPD